MDYYLKSLSTDEKLKYYLSTSQPHDSNFEQIKSLLEDYPDLINDYFFKTDNSTLLHIAAKTGRFDLLKYLISKKADINRLDLYGQNPLEASIKFNHVECVNILLPYYKDIKYKSVITRNIHPDVFLLIWISIPLLTESCISLIAFFLSENFKLYYIIHPEINALSIDSLTQICEITEDDNKWRLNYFSQVHPLKSYARTAIRKSLSCNVFYSANELPLPRQM